MKRTFLALVGALSIAGLSFAGDPAPVAPAAPATPVAPAAATEEAKPAEKAEAPKAASPIHVMMGWVAKQVAPGVANPCPATAEGEKAWRGWFDGGKDVPLATLRDAMVAEGYTADTFVAFFQQMAKKASCEGGACADGKCADGECTEGKCSGDSPCSKKKDAAPAAPTANPAPTATPAEAPATPASKPSCGGCPSKRDAAPAPAAPTAPKS
jgi:hypothetical protein